MNYLFNVLRKMIFLFLKIDFSLAILQTFWKMHCEIERLQSVEMGFANMLAPSFKNLPESLSTPAALELSIFTIIFEDFFFRSITQGQII